MENELPPKFLPPEEPEDFKAAYDKLVQIDKIVDLSSFKEYAVLVIKLGGTERHKEVMHHAFVKFLGERKKLFANKKITVLFMESDDSIDTMDEKDMNAAGWFRKEDKLIINPFER